MVTTKKETTKKKKTITKKSTTKKTLTKKVTTKKLTNKKMNSGNNQNNSGNNRNNIENQNNSTKKEHRNHFPLNKFVEPFIKDLKLEGRPSKVLNIAKFKTEDEYQNSFDSIIQFSNNISDERKKNFNAFYYHKDNTDGYTAAYIYWNYRTNGGTIPNVDITFRGINPDTRPGEVSESIQRMTKYFEGQRIIIADIGMNDETIQYLLKHTADLLIIDDHPEITVTASKYPNNVFSMKGHAASAYTYKFFHPTEKVPLLYQYVDNNDEKMYLTYLPFSHAFDVGLSVRVTKNNFIKRNNMMDKTYGGGFNIFHNIFKYNNPNMLIFMGNYMEEIQENMKFDVVQYAYPAKWLGYDVGIINFDMPGLVKLVGRQIITDFKQQGKPIDFSVCWSYQPQRQVYRMQVMEEHNPRHKPKVVQLINYLKTSGVCKAVSGNAGGHGFIANLYLRGDGDWMPRPIKEMMEQKLNSNVLEKYRPNRS